MLPHILHDERMLSQIRSLSSFIPSNQHIHEVSTRLCQDTVHLQSKKSVTCTKDIYWVGFIDELWSYLLDPNLCMDAFHYYENGWKPQIFHWPLWSRNSYYFENLNKDKLWLNEWINPLLAGSNYAPMTTPLTEYKMSDRGFKKNPGKNISSGISVPQTLYLRDDRVVHVYHYFVLHITTSRTVLPRNLRQIIEYGGGTGDNIPMLREMGFEGLHIVYDFMPMLIIHQFFLRISHWPAYYADDLTMETLEGRKTLLVSCDEDVSRLTSLLDHSSSLSGSAAAQSTLFLATWSLTETNLEVREKVLRQVIDYGVKYILIVFQRHHGEHAAIDNSNWAKELANNLYYVHGYEICSWRMLQSDGGHYYFIAVKWTEGDGNTGDDDYLSCSAAVGCSRESLLIVSGRCKILEEEESS